MARTKNPTSDVSTEVATSGEGHRPKLTVSAASGDRLATLRDLRDVLALTIVETDSARDVAALSRQLTDVLEQIDTVLKADPEKKGTALDEISKRIAERQSGAARRTRS